MQIKLKVLVIGDMKVQKKLSISIVLIAISSVTAWCSLPIGNTFMWWSLDAFVLYTLYGLKDKHHNNIVINLWLLMIALNFLYGACLMATDYWDWKLLIDNTMVFCMPIVAYMMKEETYMSHTMKLYLKYAVYLLLVLSPFLGGDAYGRFLTPYLVLALFWKTISKRYRWHVLIAVGLVMTLGSCSRSAMVCYAVALMIGLYAWKFAQYRSLLNVIRMARLALFSLPVIFLFLGLSGVFNIFAIEEELDLSEDKYSMSTYNEEQVSMVTDTRTGLWVEEIESAVRNDYVIQGRSMARGYDSLLFGFMMRQITGKMERPSCETNILNIFNYFGLIGVVLYSIIFLIATHRAVNKSNNMYMPIVGLYLSFRWLFSWIEDFTRFDLNMLFIWILVGMCFSERFLKMNNQEFKDWIRSFA